MFHFPRCRLAGLCIQPEIAPHDGCGVAPFGNLRIKACLPLPVAYRSLPRPSSPRDAKASIVCPYTLGRRSKPSPSRYVAILLPRLCSCQRATPPKRGNPTVRRDSQGLVGVPGVEPGTSSLSGTRSNQLSYTPSPPRCPPPAFAEWWRQPGSNRRHPACKAGALPTELCPRGDVYLDARSSADRTALAVRKGCGRHILALAGLMWKASPLFPPARGVSPSPAPCGAAAP